MLSVPSARLFQYMARSTIIGLPCVLDLTTTEALVPASLVPMLYDLRELAAIVSEKATFPAPVAVR